MYAETVGIETTHSDLPLFFCVRAISFSISEIFSRIPILDGLTQKYYDLQIEEKKN